jgi:peptidoglycan/xylan/chitin deacetylase (PgdA/CDA1 family)
VRAVLGILAAAALAGSGFVYRAEIAAAFAQDTLRAPPPAGPHCAGDPLAPAVTPTVAYDSTPLADGSAARYGALQYPRGPIEPYEIALTIDDGPDAAMHRRVLDVLDKHCLKATFFFIGRYVDANPSTVRETAARGHVIATHSFSHPNNLRRFSQTRQVAEIKGGFRSAEAALASTPPEQQARLAPFFRFPGLNGSPWMLRYLGARRAAVFSSDFGVDDWRGISSAEIERRALIEADRAHGGIVIVHETRPHMVEELSALIEALERKGYRFVQVVPAPDARARAAAAPDPLLGPVQKHP